MTRRLTISLMAAVLAVPFVLSAHDSSKHKGKPAMGEITAITENSLALKTADGPKTVVINDKTEILDGKKSVDLSKLKAGDHVMVYGTTLKSGDIVAKEIMTGMAHADGKMHGMKEHGHKKNMEHEKNTEHKH